MSQYNMGKAWQCVCVCVWGGGVHWLVLSPPLRRPPPSSRWAAPLHLFTQLHKSTGKKLLILFNSQSSARTTKNKYVFERNNLYCMFFKTKRASSASVFIQGGKMKMLVCSSVLLFLFAFSLCGEFIFYLICKPCFGLKRFNLKLLLSEIKFEC